MSVGVIMGGAFNAIVNAFTKILMSVATWGVPGGINGLVTVLPAANEAQRGAEIALANGTNPNFSQETYERDGHRLCQSSGC